MSRIGKKPILCPEGVNVEIKNGEVFVKGPLGKSELVLPEGISVKIEAGQIIVNIENSELEKIGARQGLVRSLVNNMVIGVTKGFKKKLQIVGVGYKSQVQDKELILNIGFSHPVNYKIPEGIKIEVDKQTEITVNGIDKEAVGQTAADIRSFYPPEPYKGKGIRYTDEYVRTKVGKTGA